MSDFFTTITSTLTGGSRGSNAHRMETIIQVGDEVVVEGGSFSGTAGNVTRVTKYFYYIKAEGSPDVPIRVRKQYVQKVVAEPNFETKRASQHQIELEVLIRLLARHIVMCRLSKNEVSLAIEKLKVEITNECKSGSHKIDDSFRRSSDMLIDGDPESSGDKEGINDKDISESSQLEDLPRVDAKLDTSAHSKKSASTDNPAPDVVEQTVIEEPEALPVAKKAPSLRIEKLGKDLNSSWHKSSTQSFHNSIQLNESNSSWSMSSTNSFHSSMQLSTHRRQRRNNRPNRQGLTTERSNRQGLTRELSSRSRLKSPTISMPATGQLRAQSLGSSLNKLSARVETTANRHLLLSEQSIRESDFQAAVAALKTTSRSIHAKRNISPTRSASEPISAAPASRTANEKWKISATQSASETILAAPASRKANEKWKISATQSASETILAAPTSRPKAATTVLDPKSCTSSNGYQNSESSEFFSVSSQLSSTELTMNSSKNSLEVNSSHSLPESYLIPQNASSIMKSTSSSSLSLEEATKYKRPSEASTAASSLDETHPTHDVLIDAGFLPPDESPVEDPRMEQSSSVTEEKVSLKTLSLPRLGRRQSGRSGTVVVKSIPKRSSIFVGPPILEPEAPVVCNSDGVYWV